MDTPAFVKYAMQQLKTKDGTINVILATRKLADFCNYLSFDHTHSTNALMVEAMNALQTVTSLKEKTESTTQRSFCTCIEVEISAFVYRTFLRCNNPNACATSLLRNIGPNIYRNSELIDACVKMLRLTLERKMLYRKRSDAEVAHNKRWMVGCDKKIEKLEMCLQKNAAELRFHVKSVPI